VGCDGQPPVNASQAFTPPCPRGDDGCHPSQRPEWARSDVRWDDRPESPLGRGEGREALGGGLRGAGGPTHPGAPRPLSRGATPPVEGIFLPSPSRSLPRCLLRGLIDAQDVAKTREPYRQIVMFDKGLTCSEARLPDKMRLHGQLMQERNDSSRIATVHLPAALIAFDDEAGRRLPWPNEENGAARRHQSVDFARNHRPEALRPLSH
jgi:hypothetical protein